MDPELLEGSMALTTDMMVVLALVGFTMVMFVWEKLRADVTAMLVLVLLGLSGLVSSEQIFQGFSGNAVISVTATMMLGAGLDRTGLMNRVAIWLLRHSKGVEERLVLYTIPRPPPACCRRPCKTPRWWLCFCRLPHAFQHAAVCPCRACCCRFRSAWCWAAH